MTSQDIIIELFKRPVAYHPAIAKAFGSVKLAILWSQLYYWSSKTSDPEGWIYKTRQEIYDETGLSRKEQETARKLGIELGILEEKLAGHPAKMHFRIKVDEACAIMAKLLGQDIKIEEPSPEKAKISSISYLKEMPEEDIQAMADKFKISPQCVIKRAEDVIDYCEAKGKSYRDYRAALRNFIKIYIEHHPQEIIIKETPPTTHIDTPTRERTPEEQKRMNDQLKKMREQLKNKLPKI